MDSTTKLRTKIEDEKWLRAHPELRYLCAGFTEAVLKTQAPEVEPFARAFFSQPQLKRAYAAGARVPIPALPVASVEAVEAIAAVDGDGDSEVTAAEIQAADVDAETKAKLLEIQAAAEESGEALTTELAAEVLTDLEGHTDLSATKIQAAYRGRKARADAAAREAPAPAVEEEEDSDEEWEEDHEWVQEQGHADMEHYLGLDQSMKKAPKGMSHHGRHAAILKPAAHLEHHSGMALEHHPKHDEGAEDDEVWHEDPDWHEDGELTHLAGSYGGLHSQFRELLVTKAVKELPEVAPAPDAAPPTEAELQALLDDPEAAAASTKIQAVYRGRVSRARKQTGDIDGDGDKEITAAEIEASDVDDETKEKLQEIAKAAEEGGEALTTELTAEVMPDLEGHTDLSATKIQAAYRGRKARADKAKAGGDERQSGACRTRTR